MISSRLEIDITIKTYKIPNEALQMAEKAPMELAEEHTKKGLDLIEAIKYLVSKLY